jgi:hypothetical protein
MRTKGLTETCSRIFAKPTMMLGENLAELQGDARSGSRGHDQDDAQECFLARDVLDSEWELVRLGGMKPGMLHAAITRAVDTLMREENALQPVEPKWLSPLRRHRVGALARDADEKQQLESPLRN